MGKQRNLESEGLERELGYLPRNESGKYVMDGHDALAAIIAGIANHQEDTDWATSIEKRALRQIADQERPQDFITVKKRIQDE